MKRFVATDKDSDPWYYNLTRSTKQIVDYIRCKCDASGVWELNTSKAESDIGFSREPKRYTHPGLVGIEYTLHHIAVEDVSCRDMDVSQIVQIPPVDWQKVLAEINTPYQSSFQIDDENDKTAGIQVEPIQGGRKWWFIKFIKFQYGDKAGKIKLNENVSIHMPVIRALRANGIMDRFKALYPTATIEEKIDGGVIPPTPRRTNTVEVFICPGLQEILSQEIKDQLGEVIPLPALNRKEFFYTQVQRRWAGVIDWKNELCLWAIKGKRMEAERTQKKTAPESPLNKKIRIEAIDQQIIALGHDRYTPPGGDTSFIKPESRDKIKKLRELKKQLEAEIVEG